MAKIDTTTIEGFDAMTPDEKVNALLNYEVEAQKNDETAELTRVRNALNKASSECAEYKRQLREKQTEAERAEADRLERERQLQEELENYRVKERLSTYKAGLMAAGIDEQNATVMAESMPDGIKPEYFTSLKSIIDEQRQQAQTAALNRQPSLSVGVPPSAGDADEAKLRKWMGL